MGEHDRNAAGAKHMLGHASESLTQPAAPISAHDEIVRIPPAAFPGDHIPSIPSIGGYRFDGPMYAMVQ